jgi:Leucine-rich repeat (LRR) protein
MFRFQKNNIFLIGLAVSTCLLLNVAAEADNNSSPLKTDLTKKNVVKVADDILVFPSDYSLGTLYRIKLVTPARIVTEEHHFADASGIVRVPAGTKVQLNLNGRGAKELNALSKIEGSLISIDGRSLEELDDGALMRLPLLKNLIGLNLDETDVSDRGLLKIAGEIKLQQLSICRTLVTGKGMRSLRGMSSLLRLSMSNNQLDDASLANLTFLKNLNVLTLNATRIGDAGLAHLGKIKSLNILNLIKNKNISDRGLQYLVALPHLNSLNISETGITRNAIPILGQMHGLKYLRVSSNGFTPADLDTLAKMLPHCRIDRRTSTRVDIRVFEPLR